MMKVVMGVGDVGRREGLADKGYGRGWAERYWGDRNTGEYIRMG